MSPKCRKRWLLIGLASVLCVSCTTRDSGAGLRQTKAVRHGFQSCTTGIEHLPYGWNVSSQRLPSNRDKTVAAWVYVTVCRAGWGFGADTPVGYQIVLYDPSNPVLFGLGADELQKYLDDNTVLAVDTTDIRSFSPLAEPPGKLTREVHDGDRAAQNRDLEILIECTKACDATKVKIRRREWNGAKLYIFLWDDSPHEI